MLEMRRVTGDDCLVLPYMDFSDPESVTAAMDAQYFIGGSGNPGNEYYVEDGHFAMEKWPMWDNIFLTSPPYLKRAMGNGFQLCLDDNNNGWYLDTLDNPPQIDAMSKVGPFNYMGCVNGYNPNAGPANSTCKVESMIPDAGNANCPWVETGKPQCIRKFSGGNPGGKTFNLRCKHYASALPLASQLTPCQVSPFLPLDNATAAGVFFNWKDEIVPVNKSNPSTLYNTPETWRSAMNKFFRSCVEGVDPSDEFAAIVEHIGASISGNHGVMHCHIGGQTASNQSPNDPIFNLIHMNVDRYWAEMQSCPGFNDWWDQNSNLAMEELYGFSGTNTRDILDTKNLRYTFDTIVEELCPSATMPS